MEYKTDEELREMLQARKTGSIRALAAELGVSKTLVGVALYRDKTFPEGVADKLGYERVPRRWQKKPTKTN